MQIKRDEKTPGQQKVNRTETFIYPVEIKSAQSTRPTKCDSFTLWVLLIPKG